MNFHDWHLFGYSVADMGQEITLHLLWDYPGSKKLLNDITFHAVGAYHFLHSDGAILTDIDETSVGSFVREHKDFFTTSAKTLGLRNWTGDIDSYVQQLENRSYKAWAISSAIGFEGFIVAQTVTESKKAEQGDAPNTYPLSRRMLGCSAPGIRRASG